MYYVYIWRRATCRARVKKGAKIIHKKKLPRFPFLPPCSKLLLLLVVVVMGKMAHPGSFGGVLWPNGTSIPTTCAGRGGHNPRAMLLTAGAGAARDRSGLEMAPSRMCKHSQCRSSHCRCCDNGYGLVRVHVSVLESAVLIFHAGRLFGGQ